MFSVSPTPFDLHHTAGKVLAIITRYFSELTTGCRKSCSWERWRLWWKEQCRFSDQIGKVCTYKAAFILWHPSPVIANFAKMIHNSGWVYYYGLVQQWDFCWSEFLLTDHNFNFCLGLMSPCLVNEACRMQYDPQVAFRGNTLPPTQYSIENWFKEQEGQKKDSPWLFRMGLWNWLTPSLSNTSHAGY